MEVVNKQLQHSPRKFMPFTGQVLMYKQVMLVNNLKLTYCSMWKKVIIKNWELKGYPFPTMFSTPPFPPPPLTKKEKEY